jgi:hypothetical protein
VLRVRSGKKRKEKEGGAHLVPEYSGFGETPGYATDRILVAYVLELEEGLLLGQSNRQVTYGCGGL